MKFPNTYLLTFLSVIICFNSYSQEISFSPFDSLKTYHIITLKDGTVLKGKIVKQEKRRIEFQDEIIGNVTFKAKEVSSIEKVEPQDHYLITMMNGTILQGKIISRKEKEIIVETANIGNVTVDITKIKTIKAITPVNLKDGKYWFRSPIDPHYFMLPSSIPMNVNEGYYQNSMLLFNGFQAGITNHLSCAGGVFIPSAVFVAPHLGYKISNGIYAGGGVLFSYRTGKKYAALGYGTFTFGNRNGHLSIGAGYAYFTYQRNYYYYKITEVYLTLFNVSGMKRLSPKFALVTENWFDANGKFGVYTGGLRLMGEKNSWDFGMGSISISRRVAGNPISIAPLTFLSYMRTL